MKILGTIVVCSHGPSNNRQRGIPSNYHIFGWVWVCRSDQAGHSNVSTVGLLLTPRELLASPATGPKTANTKAPSQTWVKKDKGISMPHIMKKQQVDVLSRSYE